MSNETYEQQMKDSDMIFTQITTGDFDNWKDVKRAIVVLYVPDMTISRSGISHVLKRLERYYTGDNTNGKR
ncbi:hypothetical protein LCGC14_1677590 [marine sediment metagenome]|uniref:Uncharacterized protein n=1 Tax=marine sediment metagenome TaxID=412755 RepID=A0A0F9K587_9ZZZZ